MCHCSPQGDDKTLKPDGISITDQLKVFKDRWYYPGNMLFVTYSKFSLEVQLQHAANAWAKMKEPEVRRNVNRWELIVKLGRTY
jgi:hypothetical protein